MVHMLNASTVGALIGVGIFGLGVHGLRHMQSRINGGWSRVRIIPDFFRKYRDLILEGAPRWPIVLCLVCCPLGIIIAFEDNFLTSVSPLPTIHS